MCELSPSNSGSLVGLPDHRCGANDLGSANVSQSLLIFEEAFSEFCRTSRWELGRRPRVADASDVCEALVVLPEPGLIGA